MQHVCRCSGEQKKIGQVEGMGWDVLLVVLSQHSTAPVIVKKKICSRESSIHENNMT